jgi:hypothetical protein
LGVNGEFIVRGGVMIDTNVEEVREARIHKMSPSADRGKLRSVTYEGIAEAMANQWGIL